MDICGQSNYNKACIYIHIREECVWDALFYDKNAFELFLER